ncbi:hypothetical protein ABEB36_009053 [Hypothenemus hampei]|uniref:Anticodon-binding domain-containing protein n=1 Tax=Hypothenemus hampei TaxID=57062 RepID=A0ABD1EPI7_HYPHA
MFNIIISSCEKQGFLRKLGSENRLKLGPVGSLLLQNLKTEWHNNMVINKENSVFLSHDDDFSNTFNFVKNMCSFKLPFGIAECVKNKRECHNNKNEMDFEQFFDESIILRCSMLVAHTDSTRFFYQWQRQRKMWWRKFSPEPGRYFLTDLKTDSNGTQTVQIQTKYSWNSQLIETITLNPLPKDLDELDKFKEGKKTVQCHSVVSDINIYTMFLNTICDAFTDSEYKGIQRTVLRFHRKLAPYKISFAISSAVTTASTLLDLNDLALHLTRQLRSVHLSTLLLPICSKISLDAQWKLYDQLGVPYNILLNEKTLKDGLVLLRSRDTTLKEQVHVSEIVNYMKQLFENY